ncbi:CaiB/BaiF CoA-transferase family protein [Microbacterium ulmi]|uniref:CoA transferase n=1 Tax=Microbacterium ulmi TaxID=179095 RepID=A0A7Y2M160_9MICO|nr:CoA transferase [Microbacterium ulmi]NII69850.1 crotonobetainyl-CoA:carnitine CoA-transferase CaiB-like acyl-CoA transferase [Microbacterium ulmi]NNH03183.1 CoA transferase [Microbacterium ulmi]
MNARERGALAGLTVVEVGGSQTLYAGKLLADQGADVVLVEPSDGHDSRRRKPVVLADDGEAVSASFAYLNSAKRLLRLPDDDATAAERLRAAMATADIVLAGGSPRELERLGIVPEALADTLLVTVTPFGWTGPWRDLHADELVLNALGGMTALGGYADGRPLQPPAGLAYNAAGLFAAVATAARLVRGAPVVGHVDVSIHEVVVMGLENAAQFWDLERKVRVRTGGVDSQVGRGVYACADGYVYIMLGLSAGSAFWGRFVAWMREEGVAGLELLEGARWAERSFIESDEAKATFRAVVEPYLRAHTKVDLYEAAIERSIPLAPVNDMADVLRELQLLARDFFIPAEGSARGRAPGAPYQLSATPARPRLALRRDGRSSASAVRDAPVPHEDRRALRGRRPLEGVRVVDFSWVGAGSYFTRTLADMGADVVKVESGARVDQIRVSPPFLDGIWGVDRSGYFADRNSSKRSMTVDLKRPEGLELVLGLIAGADVVASNFAPGTMERLGLGYEAVRARRPDVVYVSMSMQGAGGPRSRVVGYGLTIGALSGLHSLVGESGREPIGTGTNYPDHIPSPGHAAFAALSALRHRALTGEGQLLELSQVEATVAMLGADALAASLGIPTPPQANDVRRPGVHDVFPTAGVDRWIAISAEADQLGALSEALGIAAPDLDEESLIAAASSGFDGRELMEALQARGVAAGVVQDARDLIEDDPQLAHRAHWVRLPRPGVGAFLYNALPFRFDDVDVRPQTGFPALGEHTREVLEEAGVGADEIGRLEADGVLA